MMTTQFVEVTNEFNWGKFMVAQFVGFDWKKASVVGDQDPAAPSLLQQCGWTDKHVLVVDLQTGEGIIVLPRKGRGAHKPASYDLNHKHQVWVCPMFEPFLNWLYEQDLTEPLPTLVKFSETEAPSALYGYRRGSGDGKTPNAIPRSVRRRMRT